LWGYSPPVYLSSDKTEDNEMGKTCRTYGRDKKFIQNLSRKTWKENITQRTKTDGRTMDLNETDETGFEGNYWLRIGTNGRLL